MRKNHKPNGKDMLCFPSLTENVIIRDYFKALLNLATDVIAAERVVPPIEKGCGVIREQEAGTTRTWSDHFEQTLACLNVRFSPEDLVFFDNPIPLSRRVAGGMCRISFGADMLRKLLTRSNPPLSKFIIFLLPIQRVHVVWTTIRGYAKGFMEAQG